MPHWQRRPGSDKCTLPLEAACAHARPGSKSRRCPEPPRKPVVSIDAGFAGGQTHGQLYLPDGSQIVAADAKWLEQIAESKLQADHVGTGRGNVGGQSQAAW